MKNGKIMSFCEYSIFITIAFFGYLFADPPNWQDNPGAYEFSATINTKILSNTKVKGNAGDMFAAFDQNGNIRGIGTRLIVIGSDDIPFWEIQVRSNIIDENISFEYYSAYDDEIYNVIENYSFVSNQVQGDAINPLIYNLEYVKLSFANSNTNSVDIMYESNTTIAGYQFSINGVDVIEVSGGESDNAGFNISSGNNTILGFSLSGSVIGEGSGILVNLEFSDSSENDIIELNNAVISGPGGTSIANNSPIETPLLFSHNQSTLQAFYFFNTVLIGDSEVDSNDWVGVFKGDICVGARQWDISLCNSGICDLPAMGSDGNDLTNGYLITGDIPTFKIYDASENKYYDAIPSKEQVWQSLEINNIDLLYVELDECGIYNGSNYGCPDPLTCSCVGCMESDACNFSDSAKYDDGLTCWFPEENQDCTGACIAEGEWLDENGLDCEGICGGTSTLDECGICEGDDSTCKDCNGIVNGNNLLDNCGICDANTSNDCEKGCDGVWGSEKVEDLCSVCGGDNSTCTDCNSVINGEAFIDGCGDCVGGNTALEACPTDCNGVDGGTARVDECGICSAADDTTCNQGCDGNWMNDDSELVNDLCNVCGGDNSTCKDCSGEVNGNNLEDNCGTCDADSSNDCIKDCSGVWGGDSLIDECEVCGGNGPEDNYNCSGECIARGEGLDENGFDCLGNCNGIYLASFTCEDNSYACTPSACLNIDLILKPNDFGINKIFPNPFNPIANIDFKISTLSMVTLNIYDITGKKIVNVLNDYRSPGNYQVSWDAGENASGIYIIEIVSQNGNIINRDLKKILYLK